MLLILENSNGFARKIVPIGESFMKARRLRCLDGLLPPSTGLRPQVRPPPLNIVKSPASTSPLPEPPDLHPLEPREASPPPKPPDPLNYPVDTSPPYTGFKSLHRSHLVSPSPSRNDFRSGCSLAPLYPSYPPPPYSSTILRIISSATPVNSSPSTDLGTTLEIDTCATTEAPPSRKGVNLSLLPQPAWIGHLLISILPLIGFLPVRCRALVKGSYEVNITKPLLYVPYQRVTCPNKIVGSIDSTRSYVYSVSSVFRLSITEVNFACVLVRNFGSDFMRLTSLSKSSLGERTYSPSSYSKKRTIPCYMSGASMNVLTVLLPLVGVYLALEVAAGFVLTSTRSRNSYLTSQLQVTNF